MDPAIIGYAKTSDLYSHQLNEKEFGDYFIGPNKENQDTQNNSKENLFAYEHDNNHQFKPLSFTFIYISITSYVLY